MWADDEAWAKGKGNNREIMPLNDRVLHFQGAMSGLGIFAASLCAVTAALAF